MFNNWKVRAMRVFKSILSFDSSESFVEEILNSPKEVSFEDGAGSCDSDCNESLERNQEAPYDKHDLFDLESYNSTGTNVDKTAYYCTSEFRESLGSAVSLAIAEQRENDDTQDMDKPFLHNLSTMSIEPSSLNTQSQDINSVFHDLSVLIDELDSILLKETSPNVVETISFIQDRIIETVLNNGGDEINTEDGFDIVKHRPKTFKIAEQGSQILRCIRKGVSYHGETIIRAVVELF